MPDAQWYEAMGKAMAKREKCLNAIKRWQDDLAEVEAEIEALRTGEQAQQQTPVLISERVASDEADAKA